MKITASILVFSFAIILRVNNFQVPEFKLFWGAFFKTVMILDVVIIGVEGGLNNTYKSTKWNAKAIESLRSSLLPYWTFLCSQHSKLKITDIGEPFVAFAALQAPMQESHDHLMVPKYHSRLTQDLRKAATETRLVTLEQSTQWNMIVYWASNPFLVKS